MRIIADGFQNLVSVGSHLLAVDREVVFIFNRFRRPAVAAK
jgi:hypothetical protein